MPKTNLPLKIGIIGYRGFGAFCTEVLHGSDVGRVVAYAGRDSAAMAQVADQFGVECRYLNWKDLIADPNVEAVHVATPPSSHAEMTIAALQAGKHVFVEKPLAVTNEEAQGILQAVQKTGRGAGINYVMRYNPLYRAVEQIAQMGLLGKLTHVGFENYASDEGLSDSHWFWDSAHSGGIFVEHGVHFFDMIGHIVGAPPTEVQARVWNRADGTDKEDRVQAVVTYASGVDASFYHAFNRPGDLEKQSAHFAFERGHVSLNGWIPRSLILDAIITDDVFAPLAQVLPTLQMRHKSHRHVRGHGRSYEVSCNVSAVIDLGEPTPLYRQAVHDSLTDFAAAVRDPQHMLRVSAVDGAVSLSLALAARDSAINNCVVRIP